MSAQHAAVRAVVALTRRRSHWVSAAAVDRSVPRREPSTPPSSLPGVTIVQRDEQEGRVVRLVPRRPRGTLIAVHGGGYVFGAEPQHWSMWGRLAVASGREVVAPLYRLAPGGTASTTVPWVAALAERAPGPVALLGDSAGGGIVLAAALLLRDRGVAPPLLLSAPWLDGVLDRPWTMRRDPWLAAAGLRWSATLWAGDLPVDHPFISPLRHDLTGIGPAVVATGTRDVLHRDALRLEQRSPSPVRLMIGEGLVHNYPLLPIPEARPVLRAWVDLLRA